MRSFPMAILMVAPLVLVSACHVGGSSGGKSEAKSSGTKGNKSFALTGFDRVSLKGPDDVVVKVGPAFSVTAAGDTGLIDKLEIVVDGSDLKIGRKSHSGFSWSSGDRNVTITVTMPMIKAAAVAGSGDMDVDTVTGDFAASIAGSGGLKVAQVTAPKVDVDLAGSGEAELAGTADSLSISIAGSGSVAAKGLRAKALKVSLAGSGDVAATADASADISLLGSGDVDVYGTAQCKTSKVGSGDVRCNLS